MMEKDNRKSHLAPQLSPGTQDLLRSTDSPNHQADSNPAYTPTSGEIPIAGAVISPRDHYGHGHAPSRSPTRNGTGSIGRAGGSNVHPGLGQRSATSGSIPKAGHSDASLPASASAGTFTLPVRPAPGGPLPPPPPRKGTPDDIRSENRRQAAYPSSNGNYGAMGYPRK